tara:strand:- start:3584 stop:3916 length:333 start_codon:yes stop_codon:yes gene_type:complete
MKLTLTKEKLKQIIKEELQGVLSEDDNKVEAALREIIMWGEENGAGTPTMAVQRYIDRFGIEDEAKEAGMNSGDFADALRAAAKNKRAGEDEGGIGGFGGFGSASFDFEQ